MLPWLARVFVRYGAPADRQEDLIGDLEEVHAKRIRKVGRFRAAFITVHDALAVGSVFSMLRLQERSDMGHWLSWLDIKLAFRQIRKRPLLDATALLALTVGIGLSIMGLTLVDAMAFSQLPYENGDRFLRIDAYLEEDDRSAKLELDRYHLLIEQAATLDYLGVKEHTRFPITHPSGEVESIKGAKLEPGIFAFLPVQPILGRTLIEADGAQGAPRVALIHESLWHARYGGRTDIIGAQVEIAGEQREIVGVMPDDFEFPNSPKAWLPFNTLYAGGTAEGMARRAEIVAVMGENVSRAEASTEIFRLSRHFDGSSPGVEALRLDIAPYTWGRNMEEAWWMMGAMILGLVLVLVVIAANVGNLFLVRTASRSSELAVRTALGAGRARLVMQLMTEVAILTGAASILGFLLANGVMDKILEASKEAPFWLHFSPSSRIVGATALLAALTTLAAGLGPSLGATRRRIAGELKAGGRGGGHLRLGRLAAGVTILQMAISVAFVGTSLAVAQGALRYMDPQIDLATDRILTTQLGFRRTPEEKRSGDDDEALVERRTVLLEAIAAMPGIQSVGATTALPGESADQAWIHLEAEEHNGTSKAVNVSTAELLPGFLKALGVAPRQGRFFEEKDGIPGAHPVAVINERFAEKFFGSRHVLGQRLRLLADDGSAGPWVEIVGVAPDLAMHPANPELGAGFYVPMPPKRWMSLAMRVEGEPSSYVGALRKKAGHVDEHTTLIRIQPLSKVAAEEAFTLSLFGGGLVALGLTALFLSLAGIFAMTALAVTQRTREIGIRLALGASKREILAVVSKRALVHLGIGSVVGIGLGSLVLMAVGNMESGFLATSPWGLGATALILAAVAFLACAIPARRVLRIEPSQALAQD